MAGNFQSLAFLKKPLSSSHRLVVMTSVDDALSLLSLALGFLRSSSALRAGAGVAVGIWSGTAQTDAIPPEITIAMRNIRRCSMVDVSLTLLRVTPSLQISEVPLFDMCAMQEAMSPAMQTTHVQFASLVYACSGRSTRLAAMHHGSIVTRIRKVCNDFRQWWWRLTSMFVGRRAAPRHQGYVFVITG